MRLQRTPVDGNAADGDQLVASSSEDLGDRLHPPVLGHHDIEAARADGVDEELADVRVGVDVLDVGQLGDLVHAAMQDGDFEFAIAETGDDVRSGRAGAPDDERPRAHPGVATNLRKSQETILCGASASHA